MPDPEPAPIRQPGWYQVLGREWKRLAGPDADPYDLIDQGGTDAWELVLVSDGGEEVPLW